MMPASVGQRAACAVMATVLLLTALLAGAARADALLDGPEGPIRMAADAIAAPLTRVPGDPARGRAVFLDTERGHCLRCHRVAALEAPFQGTVGPDLSRVGDRLNPAQLRLRLVDMSVLNPDTVMPPYHRTHDLHQVAEAYRGKPVLAAQDIEDLIAYLLSLESNHD